MARFLLQLFALQLVFVAMTLGFIGIGSKKAKDTDKYEIKQKVFALTSSFTITDAHKKPVFKVGFKKLGLGKHLKLTDVSSDQEIYSIKHILNPFGLAKYEILKGDKVVASVKRKVHLIGGKKFKVKSDFGTFKIKGNFRSRSFKIKKDHKLVATISKKFFAIGDTYGVKIEKSQDVPFILCLAIVIDEVAHG